MEKIYGGFRKGEKSYSYGSVREDFDIIRAEILVDDVAEGLDFMANYFGKDMGNPFFEWQYREAMTRERREELKELISKAKAAKAEEVVEVEEAVEVEEEVLCSCGHSCPKSQVMYSSIGSCCPECYDRMSFLRPNSRRFDMRCKYCGGEASGYEPEVRKIVDYVPYGDRYVPMVSYEGSEATYLCDDCGRELCDDEVFEEVTSNDLEEFFDIESMEDRKMDLYMDIVNRLLAGTSEAIGYIRTSVESWQRREKESGRWDKE